LQFGHHVITAFLGGEGHFVIQPSRQHHAADACAAQGIEPVTVVVQQFGGQCGIGKVGAGDTPMEQGNEVPGAVEILEVEVVGRAGADDEDGGLRMLRDDALDHGAPIEQGGGVDVGGALRLGQRHGAVGGAVDQAAAGDAFGQQRLGCRVHEAGQGVGIQFAREHVGARRVIGGGGLCGAAIERGDDFAGAMGERRDDGGGGEEDVEHDHHLAFQALGVEFLLLQQDVDLGHAQPSELSRASTGFIRAKTPVPVMITRSPQTSWQLA
jgi:hypothetical protein